MVVNFPCEIYCNPAVKNHDSIQGDKCNTLVHRNCNKINKQKYRLPQIDKNLHWFCIICTKDFLPFSYLNNGEFVHTVKGKKIKFTHVTKKYLTAEAGFFQAFNSNLDANQDNCYLPSNFKYIKIYVKNNVSFFHLNILSLSHHFPKLHTLPATSKIEFDINDIAEFRLKSNKNYLTNITPPNYNIG